MPKFGTKSMNRLETCDQRLQDILNEAIKLVDFTVIEGHRSEEKQNKLFDLGKSKVRFPNSKHNSIPSKAVDIAPWQNGINWSDTRRFAYYAGIIRGIAHAKGITVKLGFDWDGDGDINEHSFLDFPHIEIID